MSPEDLHHEVVYRLGWSQAEFADRIGVHPNTVSKWMTGKTEVPGPVVAYVVLAAKVKGLLS